MTGPPRDDEPGRATPPVLPHVVVTVTDDETGTLEVVVDGQPVPPPTRQGWRRDDLASILDTLTSQRDQPLRVDVRESDGSTFTDILTPPRRPVASSGTSATEAGGFRGIVTGSGFIPVEQVTVAVAVLTTSAGPTGTVRAWLSLAHTTQPAGEVVLIGRISGTVTTATRSEPSEPGETGDPAAR
ncbi:hypothetical protein [Jiangella alkaliphila]|uniref:Uncharacterized protein n=1 Tax=Jiangella alkaliphila TaxID=419479 RepID=A0A1H2L8Q7_9ACTN|nr:hypothetical protein [Jiangella alkaliphila]SDU77214.1 hypothetical protein SAMN04488563_5462 [Jiangella alkaliphila]